MREHSPAALAACLALSVLAQIGLAQIGLAPLSAARAETRHYHADLNGGTERPPTTSPGSGTADISVDTATHRLDYTLSITGLTGPVTMAHIHGPAAGGHNAPPLFPLAIPKLAGSVTATDAQLQDLDDGKYYVNVHTAAHPDGEIRGQLLPAP